jgi:hypothetical protein
MRQFGLKILHAHLGLLALGDVVNEACKNALSVEAGFPNRKFDRKGVSIASPSRRHPADPDDLACSGPPVIGQIPIVAFAIGRRHQHRDIFAQHFIFGVAEQPFSRNAEIYDTTIGWRFVNPKMKAAYGDDTMPSTAENVAQEFQISREDQDAFAVRSQDKTARASQRAARCRDRRAADRAQLDLRRRRDAVRA